MNVNTRSRLLLYQIIGSFLCLIIHTLHIVVKWTEYGLNILTVVLNVHILLIYHQLSVTYQSLQVQTLRMDPLHH